MCVCDHFCVRLSSIMNRGARLLGEGCVCWGKGGGCSLLLVVFLFKIRWVVCVITWVWVLSTMKRSETV